VFAFKVLTRPLDEVVLEYSLNKLVKDVRSYQLIDICTREVICERLAAQVRKTGMQSMGGLTVASSMIPYLSQIVFESNAALHAFVCSGDRNSGSGLSRSFAGEVHLDGMVVRYERPHWKTASPCTPPTNNCRE
jgi:hypothetical protein